MRKLVKLVCERCYAIYRAELETEGWVEEPFDEENLGGGICKMCGKVEGKRTIQFNAAELLGPIADHELQPKKKEE